MDNLR